MQLGEKIILILGLREKHIFRDYFFIILGSFIMGVGIAVFLVDAKVVPGGVSGLAMAIYYLTNGAVPIGLTMWLFNIPLFIWGVRVLGKKFGVRTFLGFTANAFFIDLLRGRIIGLEFIHVHDLPAVQHMLHNDFILYILTGSILLGLGLGIIFKFHGTTAGSDVFAAVFQFKWGIKPGYTFIAIDYIVITLAGIVIQWKDLAEGRPALTLTFYAFIMLFISAKIIDFIIDGVDYARSALIISKYPNKVCDIVLEQLNRGATILDGKGIYTNQPRDVVYTVLNKREVGHLVEKVKEIDPDAFIIVNNVHEVLGEGFRPRI